MSKRKRRKYTPERKADAVRLVREVGNLAEVARRLELTQSSLRTWVKQAEIDEAKDLRVPSAPRNGKSFEILRNRFIGIADDHNQGKPSPTLR